MRQQGFDVIDFSQANCDLAPPTVAIDKLIQACLRPANHRYSASQGINKLRQAIVNRYAQRFGVSLDPVTEVCATLGTKEGLAHALLALSRNGDQVMIPSPCYPVHSGAIAIAECSQINVPIHYDEAEFAEQRLFEDIVAMHDNTWPRPKILLCSFPHNPTTVVVSERFWQNIVDFARAEKLIVLNDFAYSEISFAGYQAPSILQAKGAKEVALEFYSFSKAYGLGGWRVGFALGNAELISKLKKIKGYIDFGIFQPLQIAAVSVLEKADDILEENIAVYQARRDVLVSGLESVGFRTTLPQASVFVWAKLPSGLANMNSTEFCQGLLQEHHVAICPGSGFDQHAARFLRFALMEKEPRIRQAIKEIGLYLAEVA